MLKLTGIKILTNFQQSARMRGWGLIKGRQSGEEGDRRLEREERRRVGDYETWKELLKRY